MSAWIFELIAAWELYSGALGNLQNLADLYTAAAKLFNLQRVRAETRVCFRPIFGAHIVVRRAIIMPGLSQNRQQINSLTQPIRERQIATLS